MAGFNVQNTAAVVEIQDKKGLSSDILSLALIKSRVIRAKRRDKTEVRILQKFQNCCKKHRPKLVEGRRKKKEGHSYASGVHLIINVETFNGKMLHNI
jgi:hypothetical protein